MSERLVRLVRARAAPPPGVTDAELLRRWADGRDEAAFELLLRRHAGPVWATCRAVAGEGAEDAFQATFLALSRRAGAVRASLPGWLHRVALHAAFRARRPVGRAVPAGSLSDVGHRPTHDEADLAPLHEELARLPDRYRLPLVLCHLHGRTQAEAAAELGLPLGTVATRVRRGCDRLRVALTRRGLAPAVAFGPQVLAPAGTLAAALGVGLGAVAAPPAVHSLAHGALTAMSRTKLKLFALAALVGTAVGGGALVARHPAADPPPKPAPAAPPAEDKPADYFDRQGGSERLKAVLLAFHVGHDAAGDKFPRDILGADGRPLLSWRVALLPHLDQELLHSLFKLDEPWDSPHNRGLLKHVPKVYRSPGAAAGRTRVKAFRGPHAFLDPAKPLTVLDFTDGTSNTLAVAEAGPAVEWTRPADLDIADGRPLPDLAGPFADGFAAALCDGSVRWVRRTVPEKTLREFTSRDGGEVTPWDADGPPPPPRPLTERERQYAGVLRQMLAQGRGYEQWAHDHLTALTLAAAKLGPIPLPPDPPADATLDQLQQASDRRSARNQFATGEADRLLELLKAKDPAAAAKIEQEFGERLRTLRGKQ